MPAVQLSTGIVIRSENVEKAEYYPKNALDAYGCQFGGPEMRDCPFLFIQTRDGAERIQGESAARDATALEQAGVRVLRHPTEKRDPPL
jgi:hypothetical protein